MARAQGKLWDNKVFGAYLMSTHEVFLSKKSEWKGHKMNCSRFLLFALGFHFLHFLHKSQAHYFGLLINNDTPVVHITHGVILIGFIVLAFVFNHLFVPEAMIVEPVKKIVNLFLCNGSIPSMHSSTWEGVFPELRTKSTQSSCLVT